MSSQLKMFSLKKHCRICLVKSEKLISMENSLYTSHDSPTILKILKEFLNDKMKMDPVFPMNICYTCIERVKLIYDLKKVFLKSQSLLEKFFILNNIILPNEHFLLDGEDIGHFVEDSEHKAAPKVPGRSSNSVKVELINDKQLVVKKVSTRPLPKCRYCHKRFPTKEFVKKHLLNCKLKEIHMCDYCTCKFPTMTAKKFHIKMKHSEKLGVKRPEYACNLCNEVFRTSNARAYHKNTRHNTSGISYTCNICKKSFLIKNSYNQHMEVHDKSASKVVCPICGKSFHYRGGLFYHLKVHRNERNYVCSYCNRRFLNMTSLKRHVRTHTGERPYVCSYCPKSFCSIGEVKTHERRHTGHKPHMCKYCGKGYISLWNLKFHMSSHSGQEPCDFCKKLFLNADVLKLHMEFKHKDKLPTTKDDEGEHDFENLLQNQTFNY